MSVAAPFVWRRLKVALCFLPTANLPIIIPSPRNAGQNLERVALEISHDGAHAGAHDGAHAGGAQPFQRGKSMKQGLRAVGVVVLLGLHPVIASATVSNAVSDFSTSSNPNGAWEYGYGAAGREQAG